ncbi:MAG: protease modulator HflC [Candidatus Krumholzibacteriota bacterium]|nr:protease modulator HflC [Candidatus Krumholzibacteriota bacterium]
MRRGGKLPLSIILIIFVLICVLNSAYIINEYEQAIITQFGKPVGGRIDKAGLHFKIPFVHTLHRFEKRILIWDASPEEIPTSDKKYILLDTTARWKIVDPLLFYQSVGTFNGAQTRLDDVIDSASRDVVSGHVLVEVVRNSNRILDESSEHLEEAVEGYSDEDLEIVLERIEIGRKKISEAILSRASELMPQYGIELLDVQVKRLNYVEDVKKKVYERMIAERQRIASKYRSEGEGKSAEILGRKERELNKIQSEAYKRAQEIRGEADARSTKIYADAYRQDPEFYSFLKTLEVYGNSMGSNTRTILTTDSDIYRYFKKIDSK